MLIYILEDDDNIREIESYTLKAAGFDTAGFALPRDFKQAMEKALPDLIILDIMLPGEDGMQVLSWLKNDVRFTNIPVIIISAKTTELDRVKGIDSGADDYMCKPFGIMELVSRVKARLRSVDKRQEYTYGGITISENRRTVYCFGEKAELTFKEFELLRLLISRPETVFTRSVILETIWGYEEGSGRTLDMHITTLRKKLGTCGRYIKTVRNVGYKLDKGEEGA